MSLLKRMNEARVFSVEAEFRSEIGWYADFVEGCDANFGCRLTFDEMRQLGREIIELADIFERVSGAKPADTADGKAVKP